MSAKRHEAAMRRGAVRQFKKKGPTALARARKSAGLRAKERKAKDEVRDREMNKCRFPLCGCQRPGCDGMKRVLTVSHDFHKGMGGDPTGGVSIPALMVALCRWRHQDAPVSRHARTLRSVYLTPDQNDGPLAWEIDLAALYPGLFPKGTWFEVARETYVEGGSGTLRLEPLADRQREVLDDLAEMVR